MTRLSEIRARLDAATPGPWRRSGPTVCTDAARICTVTGSPDAPHIPTDQARLDALLIAHAPADLRWLVERVEALESSLFGMVVASERALSASEEMNLAIKDQGWNIRKWDAEWKAADVLRHEAKAASKVLESPDA